MSTIHKAFVVAQKVLLGLLPKGDFFASLDSVADQMTESLEAGGKILAAGNGGSLADAGHFVEELTGRFKRDRRPLAAIALSDSGHITCVGNDYGFEHIFSRPILALAKPEDVVLLLTTSGKSPNLLQAAEAAREVGAKSIAFTGRGGGQLAAMVDQAIDFPGENSDRIQELHMLALHALVEAIEIRLGLA